MSFIYCLPQTVRVFFIITASNLFFIFVFALTFSHVTKKNSWRHFSFYLPKRGVLWLILIQKRNNFFKKLNR